LSVAPDEDLGDGLSFFEIDYDVTILGVRSSRGCLFGSANQMRVNVTIKTN
jgi:hypothetical protein